MNELKQPQFCDGCGLNMASAKAQMNREPDLAKALQWLESWLCLDDDSIARKFATTLWQKLDEADKAEAELDALKAELKHESELTATMTKKIARLEEAGVVLASIYSVIADMSRPGARAVLENWRAALKGESKDGQ